MHTQPVTSRKATRKASAVPTAAQRRLAESLLAIGRKALAEAKATGSYRAAAALEWDAYGLPK